MSLNIKLVKKGNKFQKLVNGVRNLASEHIEVGHFKSQGLHHSGFTYPELMGIHHAAQANGLNFPDRPVLDILFFRHKKLNSPQIRNIIRRYRSRPSSRSSDNQFLRDIGEYLRDEEKKIFGSSALAANAPSRIAEKGRNSPLVDTEDLKRKTAYRTSRNKTIKDS